MDKTKRKGTSVQRKGEDMKKRWISLCLAVMIASSGTMGWAVGNQQEDANYLKTQGVLQGDDKGSLNLDKSVNRVEMMILLSRLMGVEPEAKAYKYAGSFKDVKIDYWGKGYVEWANAQNITKGIEGGKFDPAGKVNLAQVQTFLLRALGYTEVRWGEEGLLAEEVGLMTDLPKVQGEVTRGYVTSMIINALKANVKDSQQRLGEKLKLDMTNIPKSSVETNTTTDPNKDKQTEFKFESAFADNLKELKIRFNKEINENSIDAGKVTSSAGKIKRVKLSPDKKTIIALLDDASDMKYGKSYKVSVKDVKSTDNKTLSVLNQEVYAEDVTQPTILDVEQVGNTQIKLIASEPLKNINISNFKIDGQGFYGTVSVDGEIVTVRPAPNSNALKEGSHEVMIEKIEDYYGLVGIRQTVSYSMVKDVTPPMVLSSHAYMETVTLTFDEEIDPRTINTANFYWKSSGIRRHPANVTLVDGKKVVIDFSNNRLPAREETLYIKDLKDVSGNRMTETPLTVKAEIDYELPKVQEVKVLKEGSEIEVTYTKSVNGNLKAAYRLVDPNGNVISIKDITGSGAKYVLKLSNSMPYGINIFTIKGLEDTTMLKNKMEDYSTNLDSSNYRYPKIVSHSGSGRTIVLSFSENMDANSLSDPRNYILKFAGNLINLPDNTSIDVMHDGRMVMLTLPEKIDNRPVMVGNSAGVYEMQVNNLVNTSGRYMSPSVQIVTFTGESIGMARPADYNGELEGAHHGVMIDGSTIKVRFTQPISEASAADFSVRGQTINFVEVDGSDVVTLYLNNSAGTYLPSNAVLITPNNNMRTMSGNKVSASQVYILDQVSPRVRETVGSLAVVGNSIELPFSEAMSFEAGNLIARDVQVVRNYDNYELSQVEYTVRPKSGDDSTLVITIISVPNSIDSDYTVKVRGDAIYLKDKSGNIAVESDTYVTDRTIKR